MVRESLTAASRHATVFASAAKGYAFQRRVDTGEYSVHTSGGAGTAPGWVRLVRTGDLVRSVSVRERFELDENRRRHHPDGRHGLRRSRGHQPQHGCGHDGGARQPEDYRGDGAWQSATCGVADGARQRDQRHSACDGRYHGGGVRSGEPPAVGRFLRGLRAGRARHDGAVLRLVVGDVCGHVCADRSGARRRRRQHDFEGDQRHRLGRANDDPAAQHQLHRVVGSRDECDALRALRLHGECESRDGDPGRYVDLGKPAPDAAGTITVDRASFFSALAAGNYQATVTAVGPFGQTRSGSVTFAR